MDNMDNTALTKLLETANDDVLADAKTLLARAIVETHISLPSQAVDCLMFLEASGMNDIAASFMQKRRYLSPGIPALLSKVIQALALEEYMSKIQISLGGK